MSYEHEFREVYLEKYGFVKVNRAGTQVIGKRGKPLSTHWRNHDGYVLVRPSYIENKKCKRLNRLVHRLVALAFVDNPNNYSEINHIDGNKENNCADNLEWCTRQQNVDHARATGLVTNEMKQGENNGRHILDADGVRKVRDLYAQGVTRYRIAKQFGLGWTTVDHVIKGHTWTHVN